MSANGDHSTVVGSGRWSGPRDWLLSFNESCSHPWIASSITNPSWP
jgi:hypothetical protein